MTILQAIVLGVVEGLSEFLPISSTGHLMIAEKLLGMSVDDPGVGAYTAVIQLGAVAAVVVYFRADIARIAVAWSAGLLGGRRSGDHAREDATIDQRMGWYVICGSIPIGIVGFVARDVVEGAFKSLWVVAAGLLAWSVVMVVAERVATQERREWDVRLPDAVWIGIVQCFALVPGVSRSGATIAAGLFRGLDRVTATRLAFLFGIPSLTAAGLFELRQVHGIGVWPALVGTLVSFAVAYASIAWLLRFVAHHSIGKFVPYRVGLGLVLIVLLSTGVLSAT